MILKRFLAKRRLEYAYYILNFYEGKKDIIGMLERPLILVAKVNTGRLLRYWRTYGL